ncbi:MAG: GTP 3',8-cyclase MoaA [Thermoplasmata archaeon]|nr:GTP 3',8-cyclase MoaA [Thermoplasmata archaeon]
MRDRYGREVNDLRISLTQRCNLRCVFCHMEGQPVSQSELTPRQIETIVQAATRVGIRRVKLTGGEPTLRSDIVEIVQRIRPHVTDLSMTTNGLRLADLARPLAEAGLNRVNVSLPSLDPAVYKELTGVDGVERTIAGIRAAAESGMHPIKLNVVALSGSTAERSSFDPLIAFAQEVGAWLQVIEFENVSGRVDPKVYRELHSELGRLSEVAAARAFRTEHNPLHQRPRYSFEWGGRPVTVEVVQPVENPSFCMACHRLRLTSDGNLKGCLMTNAGLVDLRPALATSEPVAAVAKAFETAIGRRRPFFTGPETPQPSEPSLEDPLDAWVPLPVLGSPVSEMGWH